MARRGMAPIGWALVLATAALVVWVVDTSLAWVAAAALLIALALLAFGLRAIRVRERDVEVDMTVQGDGWTDVPISEADQGMITSRTPFQKQLLPRTGRLPGGFSHILYKEFDTIDHPDEWRQFLYDPLSSLDAHGVLAVAVEAALAEGRDLEEEPLLVHIAIYKLTEPGATGVGGSGAPTVDTMGDRRKLYRVVTTVVNHEEPLNPRIGMTSVLI